MARNAVAVIDEVGGAATLCTGLWKNMFDQQQPRYICGKMTDNVARNVDSPLAFVQIPNTEYETQTHAPKHQMHTPNLLQDDR